MRSQVAQVGRNVQSVAAGAACVVQRRFPSATRGGCRSVSLATVSLPVNSDPSLPASCRAPDR